MKKLFIISLFSLLTSFSLSFAASENDAVRYLVDRINGFVGISRARQIELGDNRSFLQYVRSLESPKQKRVAADLLSTTFQSNEHPVMQWLRFNKPTQLDWAIETFTSLHPTESPRAASSVPVEPEYRAPDEPVTMRLFDEFDLGQPVNPQELAVLEGIDDMPVVAQPIVPAQAEPEAKFVSKVSRLESLAMRAFAKNLIANNPAALQTQNAFTKELLAKYIAPQSTAASSSRVEEPSQNNALTENSPVGLEKQKDYAGLYDRFARLIPGVTREYYLFVKGDIEKIPKWLEPHVEQIDVSVQDLIDHEMIPERMRGSASLILSDMRINNLSGLQNIPNIQDVHRLFLDNNKISSIARNAFAGLVNLQHLTLENNNLSSIASNTFAGLPNLQYLNLGYNHIHSIAPNAFAGLANLQTLYLFNNDLTSISPGIFTGLPNLQKLLLSFNPITSIGPNSFMGLTNLREIWFRNNQMTGGDERTRNEAEVHTIAPNARIYW